MQSIPSVAYKIGSGTTSPHTWIGAVLRNSTDHHPDAEARDQAQRTRRILSDILVIVVGVVVWAVLALPNPSELRIEPTDPQDYPDDLAAAIGERAAYEYSVAMNWRPATTRW